MAAPTTNVLHNPLGLLAELTHRCPLGCPYCSNPLALDARENELERLVRHRPGEEVSAVQDPVDPLAADLGKHRFERRRVAVHVVERSDAQLVDDLEQDAAMRVGAAGADDGAQGPGDAALAADHLADVVLGDGEQQDDRALTLLFLDRDGVRLVHQLPGKVGEQLIH